MQFNLYFYIVKEILKIIITLVMLPIFTVLLMGIMIIAIHETFWQSFEGQANTKGQGKIQK